MVESFLRVRVYVCQEGKEGIFYTTNIEYHAT